MPRACHLFFLVLMLLSTGCRRDPRLVFDSSKPHFHRFSKGGWGLDGDYLVLPDDTLHYRCFVAKTGEIDVDKVGRIPGLFASLVELADKHQAWGISTESITKEFNERHPGISVYDASHEFITFRHGERYLEGDVDGAFGMGSSSQQGQREAIVALSNALTEPLITLLDQAHRQSASK